MQVLLQDPAETYERMDFDKKRLYRKRVAFIARHSDCTESEVAQAALVGPRWGGTVYNQRTCECQASSYPDVGFYLLDKRIL